MARRGSLEAARKTLAGSAAQVQAARGKADKARAALALPADLAPVYDGVYDEAVTAPAAGAAAPQISYTTRSGENRSISLGAGTDAGTVLIVRAGGTVRIGKGLIQTLTFTRHPTEALVTIDITATIQTNVTSAMTLSSEIRYGRVNRN